MSSSNDILFGRSEVRRSLLARLFSAPDQPVHASEAARELGFTPQAVARELRKLERAGIVRTETVGRAVRYRVDPDSPVTGEIRVLVDKTFGIEALLRDAFVDMDGVEQAFVFGSHAAGDLRGHSDIDLLVVGTPDQDVLSRRLSAIEQRIGRDINVVTYSRRELDRLVRAEDGFVRDVLAGQRIPLMGGDRDALPTTH